MLRLLDNVCREVARNGLKKVVLVNSHGGNFGLLALFNMLPLYAPRDYVIYIVQPFGPQVAKVEVPWERSIDGHAGPGETSMILKVRPDLVHMDKIPDEDEGKALGRLTALREAGVQTGVWWYADHPTHYQGDAHPSTADAGDRLFEAMAQTVARAIRAIKDDTEAKRLQDEFYAGAVWLPDSWRVHLDYQRHPAVSARVPAVCEEDPDAVHTTWENRPAGESAVPGNDELRPADQ